MKKAIVLAGLVVALPLPSLAAGGPQPAAHGKLGGAAAQQEVAYADLGKYVGKRVIVRSKLNTTRAGVLTRYTASEIDLKLDSGAELSMPADSIKSVGIPIGAPDPLFQDKK